ncbi:hypothetical protein Nmel_013874, partial [Mimus melanotis]
RPLCSCALRPPGGAALAEAAAQAEAEAETLLAPLPGGRRGGSSGQNEVQPLCDLGPQQEPQKTLQCPLPHPQENHVLTPVQGAAAEVQRALHAHPQGRRGPGGARTLQGAADREGGAGVQEEIRDLHRARAAGEGQRHHRARGHPPQQGT